MQFAKIHIKLVIKIIKSKSSKSINSKHIATICFFFVKKLSKKFKSLIINFEILFSLNSIKKNIVVVVIIIVLKIQNFIQDVIILFQKTIFLIKKSFQKMTFLIKKSFQKTTFLNFINNLFFLFIIFSMRKCKKMMKIQIKIQNQNFVVFIDIVVQLIFRNKRKIELINISENQTFSFIDQKKTKKTNQFASFKQKKIHEN